MERPGGYFLAFHRQTSIVITPGSEQLSMAKLVMWCVQYSTVHQRSSAPPYVRLQSRDKVYGTVLGSDSFQFRIVLTSDRGKGKTAPIILILVPPTTIAATRLQGRPGASIPRRPGATEGTCGNAALLECFVCSSKFW